MGSGGSGRPSGCPCERSMAGSVLRAEPGVVTPRATVLGESLSSTARGALSAGGSVVLSGRGCPAR